MPDNTENHDLITTAQEAVDPISLADQGAPGVWLAHESSKLIDLYYDIAERQPRPTRKTGVYCFTDVDSLIGYLAKHSRAETEIYADVDSSSITAVINAHEGIDASEKDEPTDSPSYAGLAGWGDHRAILTVPLTEDWKAWIAGDGKLYGQTLFAEFVEQHLPNFVTPDGATMLELAQSFRAASKVSFEQSRRLKSGETKLEFREDVEAKAGARGSIDIPDELSIALRVFERGEVYRVSARLRYRIQDGALLLGYVLIRPRDVLLDAFGGVVSRVAVGAARDVWHGTTG